MLVRRGTMRTGLGVFALCAMLVALLVCLTPSTAHAASLSKSKMKLHHHVTATLTLKNVGAGKKVTWSTSNKSVVSLTKLSSTKVRLKGLKRGTAKIKAKVGAKVYTCVVTVPRYKTVRFVAPTCTARGKRVFYCYDCKKKYAVYYAATGHTWKLIRRTEATYSSQGSEEYKCTGCGSVKVKIIGQIKPVPKPLSAEYKLDDAASGLAAGTLTVTIPEDAADFSTSIVAYWANEQGRLSDYTALASAHATRSTVKISLPENMIVPEGATKLLVHTKINGTESGEGLVVDLPEGSAFSAKGNLKASFQIMSDLHVNYPVTKTVYERGEKNLKKALADIASLNQNSMTVVVGDMVDSGRDSEFQRVENLIASQDGIQRGDVYYALGNHELFADNRQVPTTADERQGKLAQFRTYASKADGVSISGKSGKVYYSFVRDGVHHIVLGNEDPSLRHDAYLSPTQLAWFASQLEAAVKDTGNAPVFVYMHQSLYNTIAGGLPGQEWDGIVDSKKDGVWMASHTSAIITDSSSSVLRGILKKYPQVMLFDGHSHWVMDSTGNMHPRNKGGDGLPAIFNTSAVAYVSSSYDDPNDQKYKNLTGAEGYYVKVYKDGVLVMGRNYLTGKYIPSACYYVPNVS